MDLTHSGWSDIFFLGMDFPEGARVLNISIDLAVRGASNSGSQPRPPVEAWFRVIDQPVIRLTSVDLQASADVSSIAEVFDFPRDYLGLLKAGVIASGIVPPGIEGATQPLAALLARLTGTPGYGIEIVSKVNDIPPTPQFQNPGHGTGREGEEWGHPLRKAIRSKLNRSPLAQGKRVPCL